MTIIHTVLLSLSLLRGPGTDSVATALRIAAGVQLAAEEYRNGFSGGRVTAPAEIVEATLFLTEAKRSATLLSPRLAAATAADIDWVLQLVARTAPPDSVAASARRVTNALAAALGGVVLDEIPKPTPSLARGAVLFRSDCSSCHGDAGRGDGIAGRALVPPPADLTAAVALVGATPQSFYLRVTIGVAGTAMPTFATQLSAADRWALALYATTLRQQHPAGAVPSSLREFTTVARMADSAVLRALGPGASRAALAAVRSYQAPRDDAAASAAVFAEVHRRVQRATDLAHAGQHDAARDAALDAYLEFEQVETSVRARNADLATSLETAFAMLRTRVAGGASPAGIATVQADLNALLEHAERVVSDRTSPLNLFVQSLIIMLREGLEAILIVGALIAFLVKAGAEHRKRDIHLGVGAAVVMSLLTAVLLETVFVLSAAHREALEGLTMLVAVGVLFYVSYWLLSKLEVAKWTSYVKQRMQIGITGGSVLALATAAFLAVYREGFETVLFYQALIGEGSALRQTVLPVAAGIVVGGSVLALVYLAINRWGVRLPLKPFFGFTSAFLYYMAFVFAGKGVAELQDGQLVPATYLRGWPRLPALGIYPTAESMAAQGVMVLLALIALGWIFGRRDRSAALPG
jgi:high-affinity iron transporter